MLKKTILMLASIGMLASCGTPAPASSASAPASSEPPISIPDSSAVPSEPSSSTPATTQKVTVDFYLDYNTYTESIRNIYASQTVQNGEKLTKPADPEEAPFTDFPTFLGWSTHPLIEDPDMLWDFDKDVVDTKNSSLVMYGIWEAIELK